MKRYFSGERRLNENIFKIQFMRDRKQRKLKQKRTNDKNNFEKSISNEFIEAINHAN